MAVLASTVCALVLLGFVSWSANSAGFLLGALGGPLLLVGFLVVDAGRRAGETFGEWRWLPSRPTVSALALAGWTAGAAHGWFLAKEMTRWLAG
ncbi:MAG: hypothetical protein OXE75_00300 [bacterium]|nr:hypothetical protein [bacterium]